MKQSELNGRDSLTLLTGSGIIPQTASLKLMNYCYKIFTCISKGNITIMRTLMNIVTQTFFRQSLWSQKFERSTFTCIIYHRDIRLTFLHLKIFGSLWESTHVKIRRVLFAVNNLTRVYVKITPQSSQVKMSRSLGSLVGLLCNVVLYIQSWVNVELILRFIGRTITSSRKSCRSKIFTLVALGLYTFQQRICALADTNFGWS